MDLLLLFKRLLAPDSVVFWQATPDLTIRFQIKWHRFYNQHRQSFSEKPDKCVAVGVVGFWQLKGSMKAPGSSTEKFKWNRSILNRTHPWAIDMSTAKDDCTINHWLPAGSREVYKNKMGQVTEGRMGFSQNILGHMLFVSFFAPCGYFSQELLSQTTVN